MYKRQINAIVAAWVAQRDADEVERLCVEHDVIVGTAYDAADLSADEHVLARGDILVVDDPVIGAVRQQAPFPRISGQPPKAPTGAPRLGEHTDDVLTGVLGLTEDEIDELRVAGVV